MKKITAFLFITLLSTAIVFAQRRAKTPVALLKTIYKLAEAKKYRKLKKFLYQGKVPKAFEKIMGGKTMGKLLLMGVKGDKDAPRDFRYNAKGLKIIIDKHSERLVPIPQKLRKKLFGREGRELSDFTELKTIAEQRPNDMYIFEYKNVHILMVKINKSFQLVFWGNLEMMLDKNELSEPAKVPVVTKENDGGR